MNQPLHQSGVALPVGHELLWYEIRSVLGHGGFGITYLAHDKNLGRDVALKEYLPRTWADRQSDLSVAALDGEYAELYHKGLSSFMTEARTLAKFKHPNIVQVLAVFEQHNTAYIAMEYELGGSLAALLQSKQFIASEDKLKGILAPIIEGLQNVHDMGFLHRDIKPSNIYVRDDGSPVLIDFGSSRQTGELNTSDVTILITQGYTPAEQYSKGFGNQGPWTDIYSLAASTYHAISGRVVTDALQRNAAAQSGQPDPYQSLNVDEYPAYTEHFLSAINSALSVKPEDRPQSLSVWWDLLNGKFPEQSDDDGFSALYADDEPEHDVDATVVISQQLSNAGTGVDSNAETQVVKSAGHTDRTRPQPLNIDSSRAPAADHRTTRAANAGKPKGKLYASVAAALAIGVAGVLFVLTSRTAPLERQPVKLSAESPVDLVAGEIETMRIALDTHQRILEQNADSKDSLAAIDRIGSKFRLLARSKLVRTNSDLAERVADGLVKSVGINPDTQPLIISLIQEPTSITEDSLRAQLANSSDIDHESLLFNLAFASADVRQAIVEEPEFKELMDGFYNAIDSTINDGQVHTATRMIELALLLTPENARLKRYLIQ